MTSAEREASKTSTKRSAALRSPTGITPSVFIAIKGGGRPTRLLLHAKMLLIPINFSLCGVDYSLEGSSFSITNVILAACFTLRGHGTHIDLLWFLFMVDRICPLMQEHFL